MKVSKSRLQYQHGNLLHNFYHIYNKILGVDFHVFRCISAVFQKDRLPRLNYQSPPSTWFLHLNPKKVALAPDGVKIPCQ